MPHESPRPRQEIPDVDIYHFMFERNDRPYPDDHVLHVDAKTGKQRTYAQIKDLVKQFGIGLRTHYNWKKGDVMNVFSTNNIDTGIVYWGVLFAGGVISPANPAYSVDELAYQLKNSEAKGITTLPQYLPLVKQAADKAGIPHDMIFIMGQERAPGHKHIEQIKNESHREIKLFRRAKINPSKDMAVLVYSSGTTGLPKGVMLSHRNIVANMQQAGGLEHEYMNWKEDRWIAFLPFFHIYGLTSILQNSFYGGYKLIIMDRFDIEKFCSLVQQWKATFAMVVPPVVLLLAKSPVVDKYDFSSMKMMNSGAAPLTRELQESVYERIKVPVKQGYGLSECSPTTHTQRWEDWRDKIGSVGTLMSNITAKYVDEDGKEVPLGQSGELWIKGPNVMLGYWKNPEATKAVFTEDGYFKTGDVGFQDKDGSFFITDRVKELIKYKGFQVAPAELEGKIIDHPKVADVAVTAYFSKEIESEVPRAYIVPSPGNDPTPELAQEIIDWVAKNMAPYKKLRGGVKFVDVIPKSPAGKILRRLLKEQAKVEARKEGSKL